VIRFLATWGAIERSSGGPDKRPALLLRSFQPPEALLVGVRRGDRTLIPHGDTIIQPGDRVIAIAEQEQIAALRRLFARRSTTE